MVAADGQQVARVGQERLRARLGLRAAREKLRDEADRSSRTPVDVRAVQLMRLGTQVSDSPPSTATSSRSSTCRSSTTSAGRASAT